MRIERVSVPTRTRATRSVTNAYLVDESLLVDPADEISTCTAATEGTDIDHIAVTHTHPDHVGGVAHYVAETDAIVWAHDRYADRFASVTGVTLDRTFREGDAVGSVYHRRERLRHATGPRGGDVSWPPSDSIKAHLDKLAVEGDVVRDGERIEPA